MNLNKFSEEEKAVAGSDKDLLKLIKYAKHFLHTHNQLTKNAEIFVSSLNLIIPCGLPQGYLEGEV